MNYVVAHLGARMHYAVPRMLHDAGMLSRFYTDICGNKGWPRVLRLIPPSLRPTALKRLLGRLPQGLPLAKIRTFNVFGFRSAWQRARARDPRAILAAGLWAGKEFGRRIVEDGLHDADAVYTYNSEALEILTYARQHGIRAVLEQTIAPPEVVDELLSTEHERFPGWEEARSKNDLLPENCERHRAERELAELIVCGSEFVRESVAACGGPRDRCVVVPYGLNWPEAPQIRRQPHTGPLRVLTAGAVGLRKGSPYVLEAAKLLKGRAHFRLAGPLGISATAQQQLREHLELLGPVPRSEMREQFAWADVFLLPSICEGSATATYEALACGLPVICTPNTGSIVRSGEDGFIVPMRDVQAIVTSLECLLEDRDRLNAMSARAQQRWSEISLEAYQSRLLRALADNTQVPSRA